MTRTVISESTLSPTFIDDPRDSLRNYMLVDTETGTVLGNPSTVFLLHHDYSDGDVMEEMSDSEVVAYAKAHGFPLDEVVEL